MVTGLGIGGILVGTTVMASEYASTARRGLAVSVYASGYGVGAALGGLAAAGMIEAYGWRSVFLLGGILTGAAVVVVAAAMPEPVDYLVTRRPARAPAALARIARRLGHDDAGLALPDTARPAAARQGEDPGRQAPSFAALLAPGTRLITAVVWIAFCATMFGFNFVNSWTPKLLAQSGLTPQQGVLAGVMLTAGGTLGSLLFGLLATRWSTRTVLIGFALASTAAMVLFICGASAVAAVFALGVVVDMLINGCVAGLYVLTPQSYPAHLRSTGAGWAIAVGRLGAVLGPVLTGALLDRGWTPQGVYILVAAVVLATAGALLAMGRADVEANRSPRAVGAGA